MADSDHYTTINHPKMPPNPTKFYTHFLYKAIFASIFLLVLPLFPSQAPDFINQTINTRSWELLQLLFVGIAVSYGLFSKRNDESEKESVKSDNPESYVAGLLQVSSVFDDDSVNPSEENHKVHTWNSQYYRGEPIVVVAKESEVHGGDGDFGAGGDGGRTVEKPLVLPVRSLKNGASEGVSRSNSRRFSRNLSGGSPEKTPENSPEENIVFRSPIPWRSRSFKSSNPILNNSPETKIHPSSPNLSSEIHSEEFPGDRKKLPHKTSYSPTPPPPPPPPPPHHRPVNSNYTHNRGPIRPTRSFPEKFSGDSQNRGRTGAEFTIRTRSDISSAGNSFRPPKEPDFDEYLTDDKEIERFIESRGNQSKKFMNETIQTFTEHPETEPKEFIKSVAMDSGKDCGDDSGESEEEDDELEELASRNGGEMVGKDCSDSGPDVDKKADEFIAKFREQIRLQRIASIRRSTGQTPRNGVR